MLVRREICLFVALLLIGCGSGPPRAARVALAETASGLNIADEAVEHEVSVRGPHAREQVMQEVAAGSIHNVDEGLERFEVLMTPTTRARTVLRVARSTLLALEHALDAWEQGQGPNEFLRKAACAVGVFSNVAEALDALGVHDDDLSDAVHTLGALSNEACHE